MSRDTDGNGNGNGNGMDLQQMIDAELQKYRGWQVIGEMTDRCWDLCVDKPGPKMDGPTQLCLVNCVERFLDCSAFIISRLRTNHGKNS